MESGSAASILESARRLGLDTQPWVGESAKGLVARCSASRSVELSGEERREFPRHHRRIHVRFHAEGEETSTSGMTGNLSLRGAFITAPKVYPRGTRLRLELTGKEGPVVIEGLVAHAHRVPVELRALGTSGMGVRFLPPEDLISPLLPELGSGDPEPGDPEDPEATEAPSGTTGEPGVFRVSFASASDFLDCYRRDLVNGGIFVRTRYPRRPQSLVELEIEAPDGEALVPVRGRVVQVVESRDGDDPVRGGMGVELLDLDELLDRLQPLVERPE